MSTDQPPDRNLGKTSTSAITKRKKRPANLGPRVGERTRLAILEAGVAHFADYGYQRGSIRILAKRVKKNSALIRYYFGSKKGLFAHVLGYSANQLARHVFHELDALEAQSDGRPLEVEAILRAYIRPFQEFRPKASNTGIALYLRQLSRFFAEPIDLELFAIARSAIEPMHRRFADLISQATGGRTPKEVWYRFASLAIISTRLVQLVPYFQDVARNHYGATSDDDIWEHVVDGYTDMFHTLAAKQPTTVNS